jgi:NTE family protein
MNSIDSRRALVLGGGGSVGNAWLIGVIAGLFEAGVDVTAADLIIGTSAGSTAAAQITSVSPPKLLADILAAPAPSGQAPPAPGGILEQTAAVIAESADQTDLRRRMGAALESNTRPESSARWRQSVAARFPNQSWPAQRVLITAVDARTGEPVVFDRDSGVDLVDAVAASCAGGFAYEIAEHRYIDGGYRTNAENADLAAGYGVVLVLSPFGGRTRTPESWGTGLAAQIAELRSAGSRVETIHPDQASLAAFGDNMMNLAARAPSARAGHDQGRAVAVDLADFWPELT